MNDFSTVLLPGFASFETHSNFMLSFAVDVFFMLLLLFELSALDGDEELYTNTFFFHNCDIQINGLNSNIAIIKYETVTL